MAKTRAQHKASTGLGPAARRQDRARSGRRPDAPDSGICGDAIKKDGRVIQLFALNISAEFNNICNIFFRNLCSKSRNDGFVS